MCVFLKVRHAIAILIVCIPTLLAIVGSANYVTFASQVNQVKTITVGSSVTTSLARQQQLIMSTFKVISTAGTNLHCQFWNFTFTGNQGQYVAGNFTSDIQLDFYLIQDTSYQSWLKVGSCGNVADAITSQLSTMGYRFDAALPALGGGPCFRQLFQCRDADGFIVGLRISWQLHVDGAIAQYDYHVQHIHERDHTPSTSIPGFPVESIVVGMVTGLVALMILRRRRKQGRVRTSYGMILD